MILLVAACATRSAPTTPPAPPAVSPSALPVWIDADPSVGVPDRDVDDGVALLQALRSPALDVRGVSIVFGNAELDDADRIGRALVDAWAPATPVHTGASAPGHVETPASIALAAALERERLTVLVLGPATNLATALHHHPAIASNIERVVAVAGRLPGQRFTTGTTNPKGHRDFNFEKDPEAFQVVLDADVEVVLAGFELSRTVWVKEADLARWATGTDSARLVDPARHWLRLWHDTFAVDGFNPFDALAVGVLVRPDLLTCEPRSVAIELGPDDVTESAMQGEDTDTKPYLVARPLVPDGRTIHWCHAVQEASFLDDLTRRLLTSP